MADPQRQDRRGPTEPVVIATEAQPTTTRSPSVAPSPTAAKPPTGEGLLVSLYGIPHITDPDVLKTPFYFQCPPLDSFTRSYAFDYGTYQTLRYGEMASPQGRRLTTITFATL